MEETTPEPAKDDFERVQRLFDQACRLPPEQHDAFLARLGTEDPAVSNEVAELLRARHQPIKGLETRSSSPLAPEGDAPDPVGTKIGPYRILGVLGEGGMGTVYLAEQKEPVRRRVALKLIKLGMDSKEVLARFNAERQALAMMEHDNIAKVLEAGTTARGQPYFVMEHVAGLPITEHCDQNRLSTKERLKLFQKVCAGVQHAHQKGVIHRDLKPSNILVSLQQGNAVPKIIDFGIARATDHRLVEATIFTEEGRLLGTPAYMSPEQAEMSSQDIDTRTDVYSLGVILYQLLVGDLPFRTAELRKVGLFEMHRIIREQDPPKPSTRLTTKGTDSEAVAKQRATNVHKLLGELRGDLDWVVLKAMEKDRSRRYEAANELATDLDRYLDHEPLIAGPPSASYRARKFLRRYRGQVFAVGVVFVVLVGGVVAFAIENKRARENAILAFNNEQAAKANEALAEQRAAEIGRQKARADGKAREAIESASLATERAEEIARQKEDLGERQRRFDLLAKISRLSAIKAVAEGLFPIWPSTLQRAHDWLEEWEALRDSLLQVRDGLSLVEDSEKSLESRIQALYGEALEIEGRIPALEEAVESVIGATLYRGEWEWLPDRPPDHLLREFDRVAAYPLSVSAKRDLERVRSIFRELSAAGGELSLQRFLQTSLAQFIADFEFFDKQEAARIRSAIKWARSVNYWKFHVSHRSAWDRARQSIAKADGVVASGLYSEPPIDLQPQTGLVPIGMNPVTKLWEFYHLRSAWDPVSDITPRNLVIPQHDPGSGEIDVDHGTGIVFVLLPGGTFTMGAQSGDADATAYDPLADADESPPHEVTLAPFFLARHELTVGQWMRLGGQGSGGGFRTHVEFGQSPDGSGRHFPSAMPLIDWVAGNRVMARHGLSLPTEAQWEYGCRASTTTPWFAGDRPEDLRAFANVLDRTGAEFSPAWGEGEPFDDGITTIRGVGRYAPNRWGFHDMHGNVWEWCRDAYESYGIGGVSSGDGLRQVLDADLQKQNEMLGRAYRGGSFKSSARNARSANRSHAASTVLSDDLGLRPARALLP